MLGCATDAIAAWLHISHHTLRDHVKSILGKVGARSRSELMALASDHVGLPGRFKMSGTGRELGGIEGIMSFTEPLTVGI